MDNFIINYYKENLNKIKEKNSPPLKYINFRNLNYDQKIFQLSIEINFRKFNNKNQNRLESKRRKKIPRKIRQHLHRQSLRLHKRQILNRIQQNKH